MAHFADCVKGLNGGVFDSIYRVVHRNGKTLIINGHGETSTDADGTESIVGVCRDVTIKENAIAQQKAMLAAVSTMLLLCDHVLAHHTQYLAVHKCVVLIFN
jgi:hypothetical protein